MGAADSTLFRDVNRVALHTGWLHGFMTAWAVGLGFAVLGLCVAAAWWRGRNLAAAPRAVSSAAWAAGAGAVAMTVSGALSLPGWQAALAGAVVAGLWLTDRVLARVALGAALVLAFSLVYTGAQYPSDQVVGLLIGAGLALGLRPAGTAVLRWLAIKVERSPLHLLVAAHRI
ncbi:MAG TPA: hypothetical protein VFH50_10990 [Acidimicrobiales bacterium]|nr:hypothetical protein [Acidimicrobiales bacterium]